MAAQQINLSIDTIIKKDYSKSNRVKDSGLFIKGIYMEQLVVLRVPWLGLRIVAPAFS